MLLLSNLSANPGFREQTNGSLPLLAATKCVTANTTVANCCSAAQRPGAEVQGEMYKVKGRMDG